MQWRAVGFDLDDTLFDHRGATTHAVRRFTIDLGYDPTPRRAAAWFELEAEHFESWRAGRVSFEEQRRLRMQGFLNRLGADRVASTGELDAFFARYLADYRSSWCAFPDAAPVLSTLRDRGVRIGILTNGNHAQQLDKLDVIGLAPLVDVVCTSEDIGVAKPDPRAFITLADRLGCSTSEMAFIGDHPDTDVAGARAVGIAAACVHRDDDAPVTLEAALELASL